MKKKVRVFLPIVVAVVIMAVYCLRLLQWQVVNVDEYKTIAEKSSGYTLKIESARGEILDKNGIPLAQSAVTYNLVMNALEIADDRNPALLNTIVLMRKSNISWINRLPIEFENNVFVFKENSDNEQKYLKEQMLKIDINSTAYECMEKLIEKYDCENYVLQDAFDLISIRYGMTRVNFNIVEPYIISEDIPLAFVEIIKENSMNLQGVEIKISSKRYYENGTLAPHIIGTMGLISSEQYDKYKKDDNLFSFDNLGGYSYSDVIGASGIEQSFESVLKGVSGSKKILPKTSDGERETVVLSEPQNGNNVYLTIDSKMQEVLNYSVAKYVEESNQEDCIAGAAVVLDVETFGVLAASTYPSYDLSRLENDSTYYSQLLVDDKTPLFDRAFSGQFTPGSIMKPAVALACLEEGVITENTTVHCEGVYDFYKNNPLKCIGSHSHGDINISTALSSSCNSFFCDAGRLLGIDRMEVYANLFGLGEKTGVEIYENSGLMTNPEEYEKNHLTNWVDGVTIQAAIGQADSMFTPLQLATYCATIANDGVRLQTHLFEKSTDFNNENVVETYKKEIVETIPISKENLEIVQEGMHLTTQTGTAKLFSSYGVSIAAKTGTAQNPDHSDSTTFIAYAPYEKPEIAVAVVIQYGKDGKLSRSVVEDVFDYYFFGKTVQDAIAKDS